MKRLRLTMADGSISRLELPDDARFTFGPAIPGPQTTMGPHPMEYAVRVYLGKKENLVAAIPGVRQVIDETIRLEELTGANGRVRFDEGQPQTPTAISGSPARPW